MRGAAAHGRQRVEALLARKRQRRGVKSAAGVRGLLVAEGDSWFDFPGDDVLALLEDDFGYRVESVAHKGDTAEGMAYDNAQLQSLTRLFEHIKQDSRVPRAILLSAGGNDVAGDEFALLLNHAASGLPPLNERIVAGVLEDRLRFAIGSIIAAMTTLAERLFGTKIPIVLHGYANPVPDGRGFVGGFWVLPGPWLKPGFAAKGYEDMAANVRILEDLIARFNGMLQSIAGSPGFEHVSFVDLRRLLSNELTGNEYRRSWTDELHPTDAGFGRVAGAFDEAIKKVAPESAGTTKTPRLHAERRTAAPPRPAGRRRTAQRARGGRR
jgi:lysophospholipase L1-like esterase